MNQESLLMIGATGCPILGTPVSDNVTARRGIILIDALLGAIILAIALAAMIGLAGRAVDTQARGDEGLDGLGALAVGGVP